MVRNTPRRRSVPRLEQLEPREVPSASPGTVENFDTTAVGGLPPNWSQWTTSGSSVFAVSAAQAHSAPNGLAASAGLSNLVARAWLGTTQPADVQVSAAIYASTLIPAQVFARGSGLNTAGPSYYALSVTRGLQVQLVRVVNGTATTLGTVQSASYFSGQWVSVTLTITGTTLQAQVQRLDTGQYLTATGQWQAAPAVALTLTDTALSGPGQAGLARPASYTGTVTFDDFGVLSLDTQPPAVAFTAPAAGGTVSGTVAVQATASDNVGVTKVEFYLDNTLETTSTAAPYSWSFDTTTAANGTHALKVLAYDAAGNIGQATESVTVQNAAGAVQPTIPQHYSWIRLAELAYSGTPMDSATDQLLQNSIDLVVPNPAYLGHINAVSPNTPQLIYSNFSNLYQGLLTDWLSFADALGYSREDAFYHVAAPTAFSGNSGSSQPVTWFWAVYRGGSSWANLTSQAHGGGTGGVTFGGAGQSLALGYPERFREINVKLTGAAAGGWSAVLEYPTAVDANGNPTAWGTLTPLADGTAGLTASGQITFDPPPGWVPASINGSARLYYVRFRTTSAGGTAPVAATILGRDYVGANGGTSGTIPVFDSAADTNHDGYLNDAEYATALAAGDTARFAYESRLFAGSYGQMRFATDPSPASFQAWAADYAVRSLQTQPLADGLFVDNSSGKPPAAAGSVLEPIASYGSDYGALLGAVNRAIAPRWIVANTAGGSTSADPVLLQVPAGFEEFALRPLSGNWQMFQDLGSLVAHREALRSPPPYLVLDSLPTGGSPTDGRTQLATLAEYYLLADPHSTFLDFYGGYAPATSWSQHWSPAAAYNVGQPVGTWSLAASGADPSNPALTYKIFQRSYTNALVLYKPLSYTKGTNGTLTDASATTYTPGGTYQVLQADGTLGPVVTSVTLRNGEGAILIKVASALTATATHAPAAPAGLVVTAAAARADAVRETVARAAAPTDVTARVRLRVHRLPGHPRRRFSWRQVIITNTGGTALPGPLSLELSDLGAAVLVWPARRSAPGSPGSTFVPLGVSQLNPRQSVIVTLAFDSPGGRPVRFSARVLDGTLG
jgi:hypothetical protein